MNKLLFNVYKKLPLLLNEFTIKYFFIFFLHIMTWHGWVLFHGRKKTGIEAKKKNEDVSKVQINIFDLHP